MCASIAEPDRDPSRPTLMMTRIACPLLLAVVVLGLAGCAHPGRGPGIARSEDGDPAPTAPSARTPSHSPSAAPHRSGATQRGGRGGGPPTVTLRYDGGSLELPPYSYCYGPICVDGAPPQSPPSVGSPARVIVHFPLDGWSFQATFDDVGQRCGRTPTVGLEQIAEHAFLLEPVGPSGTYDVRLFAQGGGDLATVFRWSTPVAGPRAAPEATVSVLARRHGQVVSLRGLLSVTHLAHTPEQATARLTVTDADGDSQAFGLPVTAKHRDGRCHPPPGTIYFQSGSTDGAAELGPGPFTYRVVLTLDGVRHVATATRPTDVADGQAPSLTLHFSPALPGSAPGN